MWQVSLLVSSPVLAPYRLSECRSYTNFLLIRIHKSLKEKGQLLLSSRHTTQCKNNLTIKGQMQKSSQSTSSNVVLNPAWWGSHAWKPQTAVFPAGKQGWVGGIPSDQTVLKGHQKDALKLILVILAVTVNHQERRNQRLWVGWVEDDSRLWAGMH